MSRRARLGILTGMWSISTLSCCKNLYYSKGQKAKPERWSNSWSMTFTSDNSSSSFYDDVLAAWHVAKIIPVFSAGENRAFCESIRFPGYHEKVITVGYANWDDFLPPSTISVLLHLLKKLSLTFLLQGNGFGLHQILGMMSLPLDLGSQLAMLREQLRCI